MRKVLVMLLFTISLTGYATVYYIDPTGQDASSRNGTISSPWKSLAYACSRVRSAGDIIHVNSGNYSETSQSLLAAGVSIEGEGVSSNIVSGISKLNTYTILLSSSAEATEGKQHISGIKMDGNSLTAYGAVRVAYRKNVEISNCIFVDFKYFGISFINGEPPSVYATGNKFHDNTITNCSGYFSGNMGSLEIQGQDGMLIYNNIITQSRSNEMNGDIIYAVEGYLKNVKIYDNVLNKTYIPGTTKWDFALELWHCLGGVEIYDNEITGSVDIINPSKTTSSYSIWVHNNKIGQPVLLSSESIRGFLLEANQSDVIIEKNLISNVAAGIYLDQLSSAQKISNIYINANIFNNIGVSDAGASNKGWGIVWTAESYTNHTVSNINICNNVMAGHSGSRSTMWGINLPHEGTAKNITIRNNIIRDFDYAPIYAYTQTGSETIDILSIENNIFYLNGNNNLPKYTGITPTHNTTQNNITANPLFVSSSDFHLQAGSPAIGKGLKITGLTLDFDGNPYNDPPSIGAFEFNVPVKPVYQNAVIQNSAPSILEITYNYSLANIIPPASSFTVMVNSVARGVNTVSLASNKVRLTLAEPVKYKDIVTVSYIIPAVNPIQTISGGEADNISSKPVTNNVAAVVPVYSGSSIEDFTPNLLTMTFTLNLAGIIPSGTAFDVKVDSVSSGISGVSISGNKVLLTLSGTVGFGDIVTVSYTIPATNPLQGSTGALASAITAQPVTNNVRNPDRPNGPPVVVIENKEECYSGFVYEIDATGTYDPDKDPLTYEWIIPANISVSSSTDPAIYFLAPVVSESQNIQFQLKVGDGKSSVTKTISLNILPYKPEIGRVRIANIEGSSYDSALYPGNVLDGNLLTYWSASGDNQWLIFKLATQSKIDHIEIAFLKDQKFSSYFEILASRDTLNWEPVISQASCDFTGNTQVFDFPASFTDTGFNYLKFVGHGNSLDNKNTISEFKAYGTMSVAGVDGGDVIIYPNPASDFFYIYVNETSISPDTVRIVDLDGKIVYKKAYEPGLMNIQIPPNIKSGIYIVELSSGFLTLFAQKLMLNK